MASAAWRGRASTAPQIGNSDARPGLRRDAAPGFAWAGQASPRSRRRHCRATPQGEVAASGARRNRGRSSAGSPTAPRPTAMGSSEAFSSRTTPTSKAKRWSRRARESSQANHPYSHGRESQLASLDCPSPIPGVCMLWVAISALEQPMSVERFRYLRSSSRCGIDRGGLGAGARGGTKLPGPAMTGQR
jgi:hypothetical protein